MGGVVEQALPAGAPQRHGWLVRGFGRMVLALGGWRVVGSFPDQPKLVMLAVPHTSAWDGIWGLAAKLALGVDIRFLAKAELFRGLNRFWLGPILRWFGAVPADRHAATGLVGQTVDLLHSRPVMWVTLAPEGTRKPGKPWRSGFWHIARQADVPVFCAWFDYPSRRIGLGDCIHMSDDCEADIARLREYYRPYRGKHRGVN
ncbi:1-acyl-sn-glycerol-3-phosphate acyltransferase [Pseudomarimonas arenosa]|uniref:1-acyl-sn-glycerol-3-phosphate acyltransferase n=1 Tax=Pseudomarimonas arenosa TaxID=2774145 RepID=A0AAW3ZIL2_9GAMM|nr:1-acyl-sn-glycerol-3-phosphate acyltransferase [Pseudomarimonas arenosa]MBD8525838.1 1-acyl-sn-glycerol-3-phosphate acyltransferase [Pseudomarimonas arenosa]